MDFLDPAKKRALRIRLIIGYVLIGLAIGLVTLILVFQSYGYDLDRKTGAIIQNGLLFITTRPQPADIYLDGTLTKSQSNARLVLPSDVYKIELKRAGYRGWQRTISLAGGGISRLVYPFLFPTKLDTKDQQAYATQPEFATQSPDRHWMVVQQPGKTTTFDIFDTSKITQKPISITLPDNLLTKSPTHQFTLVEWSTDNRHFLLKDDYSGGNEFIMVDRVTPASSYNVNTTFKLSPTMVHLSNKAYDRLFLYDGATQTLSSATLKDDSVKLVANNVAAFKSYGANVLLYATTDQADPGIVRIMYQDGDGSFLLRQLPIGSTYLLNLAQYNGDWYVAAGSSADGRVFVYKNPQPVLKHQKSGPLYPATVLRVPGANWMEFSTSTEYLAVENSNHFAVYDFEDQHSYSYTLPQALDAASPHAVWMDDARLLTNSGGQMLAVDFDGFNQQTLTANLAGLPPMFDRDYKLLFNLAPSVKTPGQFALTRTDLVVK